MILLLNYFLLMHFLIVLIGLSQVPLSTFQLLHGKPFLLMYFLVVLVKPKWRWEPVNLPIFWPVLT